MQTKEEKLLYLLKDVLKKHNYTASIYTYAHNKSMITVF